MPTTNWSAFPPSTTRLRLDEKWVFVGKKEKSCHTDADEGDALEGDQWDFVALGPDSRLVLSVLVGKRLRDNAVLLLQDVKKRLNGTPGLITSDEWPAYPEAIKEVFGQEVTPPRAGRPGRPAGPREVVPEGLCHATVHKTREKGRAVKVRTRVARGTAEAALGGGRGERVVPAEAGRHGPAPQPAEGPQDVPLHKELAMHEALTDLTTYSYNSRWPARTPRQKFGRRRYRRRTPAMAAGGRRRWPPA